MKLRSFLLFWARNWRSFSRSEEGITLPLLALSLVAITGTAGLAIDVGRTQLVQSNLQFSLDAAGLAAGSVVSTANLNSEVGNYLNANFNGYLGATVSGYTVTPNSTNTVFTLTATATLPTTFLGIFGVNTITVNASSQITRSITGIELVLVLDNTGSMMDTAGAGVTKLQALQSASTTFINTLFANGNGNGKLWVGIVPFSEAVNIGTSYTSWINPNYTYDGTTTPLDWGPGGSWGGCVDARLNGEDVTDDPPTSSNPNTLFGEYYWTSDSLNTDGVRNSNYNPWKQAHTKHGVTTYTYESPLNTTNQGPNLECPQQITPMTNNSATLLAAINSMTAQGDTLINQGLVWGWNLLSPRWQGLWGGTMNANGLPLAYNTPGMAKAVVLMTDGYNTIDNLAHGAYWFLGSGRAGSTNATTAVNDLNNKTLQVCNAMKANGIYIYTIALGTETDATSLALLQNCATGPTYYYNSPSTSQLQGIFDQIGDSLSSLRVSQ